MIKKVFASEVIANISFNQTTKLDIIYKPPITTPHPYQWLHAENLRKPKSLSSRQPTHHHHLKPTPTPTPTLKMKVNTIFSSYYLNIMLREYLGDSRSNDFCNKKIQATMLSVIIRLALYI